MNRECEKGTVVEVKGHYAVIETDPASFCSACSSKGRCMMAQSGDGAKRTMTAYTEIDVKVGDTVHFEMNVSILKISFLFYLLPAVLMFAGFYAGYYYLSLFENAELNSFLGGACGIALAALIVYVLSQKEGSKKTYQARIIEIAGQS